MWKYHADELLGLRQMSFHERRVLCVYNIIFIIYDIFIIDNIFIYYV